METDNRVAKLLIYIGIAIIVLGILLGFMFGNIKIQGYYESYSEFSWGTFLIWSIGGTVSGILFIGFGEIVRLLDSIDKKARKDD